MSSVSAGAPGDLFIGFVEDFTKESLFPTSFSFFSVLFGDLSVFGGLDDLFSYGLPELLVGGFI